MPKVVVLILTDVHGEYSAFILDWQLLQYNHLPFGVQSMINRALIREIAHPLRFTLLPDEELMEIITM